MRSCKSFEGPVKLGFSMWLPVLRSGKGLKVFPMSVEFSRLTCMLGTGSPILMEGKGRESIGCPDVKH